MRDRSLNWPALMEKAPKQKIVKSITVTFWETTFIILT